MFDKIGIAIGEASTWRGLTMILTSVGVLTEPAQADAIVAGGLGIAGLIGLFTRRAR